MVFDVSESRFFDIENIKEVLSHKAKLIKKDKDSVVAYFDLEVSLTYLDNEDKTLEKELILPIELNVRENEEINVILQNVVANLVPLKGVELEFFITVNIDEIEEILDTKAEEIKEKMGVENSEELVENFEEIPEKIEEIIEEKLDLNIVESFQNSDFKLCSMLRNSVQKYRVISLENEADFDKISLKYNIKIEELFKMKKEGLKVIVCVKE